MGARRVVAVLLVLGGVAGGWLFFNQVFETTETITVQVPPDHSPRGPLDPVAVDGVIVRCTSDGRSDYRSAETGGPLFFDGTGATYPDPRPICEAARGDRLPAAALIAIAGLLAAVVVLALGRPSAATTDASDMPPDGEPVSAAVAAARRPTDPPGAAGDDHLTS